MIKIYCKDDNNDISVFTDFSKQLPDAKDILWIDMLNPESSEFKLIASKYNVEFPTKQETEEIEVSSRYWESSKDITVNTYFFTLVDGLPHNETVSFILQDNFLVTIR